MKTIVHVFSLLMLFSIGGCESEYNPAESSFRHSIIDPQPSTGKDCCTDVLILGDINGDRKPDVIIGSEQAKDAGLVWYQYPSWEKHPIAKGEFTTDGQAVDIDHDGDLDIVIGNYVLGKETIDWFENVLGTEQGQWIQHTFGKGYAHDLEVGDIDGDGDMDVVTCDKKKIVLWEQVTPTSFREYVILARKGEGLKLADIDRDGDLDIVFGGSWLENPGFLKEQWAFHLIADKWSPDTRVFVADMNKDGRLDVVLSASEGKGKLSWFESPKGNPVIGGWIEHPIEKEILDGAHSLQVADLDNDGDLDVVVAEMHTSNKKRVLIYFNEAGVFKPALLADTGSHNMRLGDIDEDGDIDIIGKNYAGPGRVIEMWENQFSNTNRWNHGSIDAVRPKSQKGMMGLIFTDVDQDGFMDVVAGSFVYRNPSGKLWERWLRTELPENVDVYFAVDIDGDKFSDLVGITGDTVFWIEALDEKATSWKARPVGKVAQGGRTQGYIVAKLVPGEKPQLIFTRGKKHLYALEIPPDPERNSWPIQHISTEAEEEGVAVGDIDGDGDLDIATVGADGQHAIWIENPGTLVQEWTMHMVGETPPWADRVALVDIDRDGRLDLVCTVERQETMIADALFWFQAPVSAREPWTRHLIARHRSLNSMSAATSADGKGTEIIAAEHTDLQKSKGASDNLTLIYRTTDGGRRWVPEVVERGPHSSHLGAQPVDLDNDGVKEILSLGWNQYQNLHLWTRTAKPAAQ